MGDMAGALIFIIILALLIMVSISRWIFRINAIVDRLDKIVYALDGKPEKAKSFMDGIKKGMAE